MKRTIYNGNIREENVGQEVTLAGWVSTKRNLGSLLFFDLRDSTGIVQVFTDHLSYLYNHPDISSRYRPDWAHIKVSSYITIRCHCFLLSSQGFRMRSHGPQQDGLQRNPFQQRNHHLCSSVWQPYWQIYTLLFRL